MKVILAKTYGFCLGVKRAIEIAQKSRLRPLGFARGFGGQAKLFILGEIVHNPQVVADLEKRGIKSVKDLKEIPEGSTVVFSAHGVAPAVFEKAQEKKLKIIDATCPLVLKVHALVKNLARQGYEIIYLGDPNHEEAVGVVGEAPERVILLNPKLLAQEHAVIKKLKWKNPKKPALVTQTTLSSGDTQEAIEFLKEKFPGILVYNTICQATEERQKAVEDLAKKVEVLVVVGGKKSANTKRLWELAQNLKKTAYWIEEAKELKKEWFAKIKNVGVTAGASTPDWVTQDVVKQLKNWLLPKV